MSTAMQQYNARLPKLAATRIDRARAHHIATTASACLHNIAVSCTTNDDAFARLQSNPAGPQSLSSVFAQLASVKTTIAELEGLLPKIEADWNE